MSEWRIYSFVLQYKEHNLFFYSYHDARIIYMSFRSLCVPWKRIIFPKRFMFKYMRSINDEDEQRSDPSTTYYTFEYIGRLHATPHAVLYTRNKHIFYALDTTAMVYTSIVYLVVYVWISLAKITRANGDHLPGRNLLDLLTGEAAASCLQHIADLTRWCDHHAYILSGTAWWT